MALNWSLCVITPHQVLQSLLGQGVLFENETYNGFQSVDEHIVRKVRRLCEFFCELATKSWKMQVFPPTHIAASCLIGARMVA